MEFQNKTVYNARTLAKMNQAVDWSRHRRDNPLYRAISLVLPVALLGSGGILVKERGLIPIAVAELVLGALILLWAAGVFNHIRGWLAGKLVLKGEQEYQIDFDDTGYQVTYPGGSTEKLGYDTLWRGCETRDYLVLIVGKRTGYIMGKDGFTKGSAQDLRPFLEKKLGQPFQVFPI